MSVRRIRLSNDLDDLRRLPEDGPIRFRPLDAGPIHERFQFDYHLRSYRKVEEKPQFWNHWRMELTVPADYPRAHCFHFSDVRFLEPIPFNPHVFRSGNVCLGNFPSVERLVDLVCRIGRMLQLQADCINLDDAACLDAARACRQGTLLMPCDDIDLLTARSTGFALQNRRAGRPVIIVDRRMKPDG